MSLLLADMAGADLTTALIGLAGAIVGAAAAVVGARWATKSDLRERNRHALHLDELPAAQDATANKRYGADMHFNIGLETAQQYAAVIRRVADRSALLGRREKALGEQLHAAARQIDGEAEVLLLTPQMESLNLGEAPWPKLLASIDVNLAGLRDAVRKAL